jgi:hypothetical protein
MEKLKYNYEHFGPQDWDVNLFEQGVEYNMKFPLDAVVLNSLGEEVSLETLKGRRFVLETGSITCPHYINNIDSMNELNERFEEIPFLVVYVREEHPGENFTKIKNTKQKQARAFMLKEHEDEKRHIYVDRKSGKFHRAIGSYPNIVYVVNKEGIVEFKRFWNEPSELRIHLSGLINYNPRDQNTVFSPDTRQLSTTLRILFNAGHRAIRDHVKSRYYVWRKRQDRKP